MGSCFESFLASCIRGEASASGATAIRVAKVGKDVVGGSRRVSSQDRYTDRLTCRPQMIESIDTLMGKLRG